MSKRSRGMNASKDKKVFSKTAGSTKAINVSTVYRGGVRL
mgnify:CR=1 FL=1